MLDVIDTATSALTAQRTNLNVIAGNIAARDSYTVAADGTAVPYRRRVALFAPGAPGGGSGVRVTDIVQDHQVPFGKRWDPSHPYAVKEGENKGYVLTSNVNYHTEMVNALVAARAYEANVTVLEMAKTMTTAALRLIA